MRKILMPLVLVVFFAGSCNPDLLDTEPHNKYVESNFWTSATAAKSYLTSAYAVLTYSGLYGGSATPLWQETATPNAYNNTNAKGFNTIAEGNQDASSGGIIPTRWEQSYGGIGRCNTFLANVDKVKMDADLKERMRGEALFLRALYYFNLENYWGDVPLILAPPNPSTQAKMPRTPRAEVVEQIIKDLDSAAKLLPLSYDASDLGRATKGAALALKAKVLLFEASPLLNTSGDKNKWDKAADAAKVVIDLQQYELYPDYRGLFLPENENNQGVIFDVQFIYPDGGNSFDLIDRQYNTNAPLLGLVKAYEMKNGLPITDPASNFDPNNPYKNRDPRFYATVVFPGDTYMGETVTEERFAITGFGVEKYSIYTEAKPDPELSDLKSGQSYTNYILLRYSDILLMYAEAQNEFSGPDASVYDAINQVRLRAGMPTLPAGLSQPEMRERIRHERRIEFASEGLYYNDIRRWKTAEVVMNASIYAWDGSEIATRHFDPTRDYWWPIPQEQLDLNDKLVQNPNY